MENLTEALPKIIEVSAQSYLGILALLSVVLAALAHFLFSGASEKAKAGIFVLLFLGVAAFGIALFRVSPQPGLDTPRPSEPGSTEGRNTDLTAEQTGIDRERTFTEASRTAAGAAQPRGRWGIVIGSSTSLAAARAMISEADKRGIPDASVFLRNGYYASIAVVEDRSRAEDLLTIAKTLRGDAYVAAMQNWCAPVQQRDGFIECGSTR